MCIERDALLNNINFFNWNKSGIIYIKDLIFEGSNLNEHFLLTKIKHKVNIFIEILELKQALLPYADLIKQIPVHKRPINNKLLLKYLTWKTKEFYQLQIRHISESPIFQMYKKCFNNLHQQKNDTALRIRIKTMPDKKLAEFNFKVMQNNLICGHYLSKWQDSVNENCEICNTVHDIPHLLFDCDLAQYI